MSASKHPGMRYKGSAPTIPGAVGGLRVPKGDVPAMKDVALSFDGPSPSEVSVYFGYPADIGYVELFCTKQIAGIAAPTMKITIRTAAEIGQPKPPTVTFPPFKDYPIGQVNGYDLFETIELGGSITFSVVKAPEEIDGSGKLLVRFDYLPTSSEVTVDKWKEDVLERRRLMKAAKFIVGEAETRE